MMKYSNYFILLVLLSVGILFKDYIHLSTNLLSLFASKDAVEKLKIADNLGYSKELLIAVKGFDKESKSKVLKISKELESIDNILSIQSTIVPSYEIQQYYKKNYSVLATFNDANQTSKEIKESMKRLYDAQFTNIFYTSIDKNDPLKLFNLQNKINNTNNSKFIILDDYGYLIRVSTDVSASQMDKAKVLYKDIHFILDNYDNIVSFAPFYYTVENSLEIQKDVQWIIILSTIILLVIYYLLIKNLKLLLHTLIALSSSMIFAILVSTLLFENFNVLSLAFGMSISAVSIDYLLHYYFHNFYQNNVKVDKNVLYGYITTTVAFGIFTFIPIPLLSQISFFAVVSLSFSYILFTFVFPRLSIDKYVESDNIVQKSRKIVPSYIIFILSIILFIYSSLNITLDNNIKHLDYQNKNLQKLQLLFTKNNNTQLTPIIVQASSKDKLIENLHLLDKTLPSTFSFASFIPTKTECLLNQEKLKEYDFDRLKSIINEEAVSIGFRKDYFEDSYDFAKNTPSCDTDNFKLFESYGLKIFQDKEVFYTMAFVSDVNAIKEFSFISDINIKKVFSKLANNMYKDLLFYSVIVVVMVFILLFISVKEKILYAVNYILFPISLTLAILVSFTAINLMHLFSLIILIAIGIDYGIYMSNTSKLTNTILAIKYSILSTFAAFGVLVFSSIVALNSIGIVISLGVTAIYILIKVMK